MKILMCRPDYYGIEYEINPWMNVQRPVDHAAAVRQWEGLYKTIQSCGAQVELVAPIKGLPDLVFTANAGLFFQGKIILANFKFKQRQGEVPYFKTWFEQAGFVQLNVPGIDQSHAFFEGAGDALPAGNQLFAGYGFRTEREFYKKANYLDQTQIIYCELVDPYFYHLDTCFCPLNDQQAIWNPAAFSKKSQKNMADHLELFAVNEIEAKRFACNAVVLDKQIIIPTGCPQLTVLLEKLGYTVHACAMDEYIKAGGACKCLTLRVD